MGRWANRAVKIQSRIDALIQDAGNTYFCVETQSTFKALMQPQAANDFPFVDIMGTGNNANTEEMDPQMLIAIDRSFDLRDGYNIHLSTSTDPSRENYRVEGVNSEFMAGLEVRRYGLIFTSPILD